MTGELEDRIGSLLIRKAARIDSYTGRADLAAAAYRHGRRLRTRRRVLSGLAGLTALAVAVPLGLNLLGPGEARVVPAENVTPATSPALPTKLSTVEIDLKELPKGPPPAVPWYADGAIHDGDRTVPVEGPANGSVQFYPVAGGYVVQVGQRTRLLDADGGQVADITRYGKFPSVSSDGRRLATVAGRVATLLDASTGQVVRSARLEGKAAPGVGVVGFLEGSVLLGGTATPLPASLWNPETDEITPFEPGGIGALNGRTDGRNRVITATKTGACYVIYERERSRRPWQPCGVVNPEFTADGRFLVAEQEGTGPLVMDAATGRKYLQVSGLGLMYTPTALEPSGAMLFLAADNNTGGGTVFEKSGPHQQGQGASVVRCTLAGQCEIAVQGHPGRAAGLPDPSWLFF